MKNEKTPQSAKTAKPAEQLPAVPSNSTRAIKKTRATLEPPHSGMDRESHTKWL